MNVAHAHIFSVAIAISKDWPAMRSSNGAKHGARDRTRTCTPYGTRPSNVCVYQFHHPGSFRLRKAH